MTLFFLIFSLVSLSQDSQIYFEDDKVQITYTLSFCELKNFNTRDEYFIIQVRNKTDETLVINFNKGIHEAENQEDKIAFVLNPAEIKKGSCKNDPLGLSVFKRDLNKSFKKNDTPFNLSNIQVVEVY